MNYRHIYSEEADKNEQDFTQEARKLLDEIKRENPAPMPAYPRD